MYYQNINTCPKPVYMLSHQWYYHFAIGVSLEVVWVLESFSNESVVVDFAIDSKGNAFIAVGEWLGSTVDTNNTQTFVSKDCEVLEVAPQRVKGLLERTCLVGDITSGPIWATMPALLHHLQSRRLESLCIGHMVTPNDTTHVVNLG
jgi:hypothetical protein